MRILDTDHHSELDRASAPGERLKQRLSQAHEDPAVTLVTVEEHLRGWLAELRRETNPHCQSRLYDKLGSQLELFSRWIVLRWDEDAADLFMAYRRQGVRIGTQDLKIACIAIAHDAVLLSRNLGDFRQVPGLKVENWLD